MNDDNRSFDIPAEKPAVQFVQRPWGFFKQFAHNEPVTVSLMTVSPGQRLSLQSHTGRAELWVVLDAGARIEVGSETFHPQAGDEIWIPRGSRHRLASTGPTVRVLEIAFGNWQQTDITRFEDDFNRPKEGE